MLLAAVVCVCLPGCSPPGPRALLQGKKLIEEGRPAEAVVQLERAAELLPKNALAWNYLGLAYHANQQLEQAARAYRIALSLDHKLTAVRYNLGCLYLEQEHLPEAIDELRSYTLLQPGAIEGWLKQGAALVRARRLDEAEKSFRAALDLQAKHPEAVNGLGLVQMQRRRWQEALNHFNVAALQEPPYAPAVLNSAVLYQQLNNRNAALQRYRKYLALQPRASDADAVVPIVRQLESELNPASMTSRLVIASAAVPKTNVAFAQGTNSRPTQVIPPSLQPVVSRTNASLAAKPVLPPAPPPTNLALTGGKPAQDLSKQPVRPAPAKGAEVLTARSAEVEVTQVQSSDLVIKPPQDLARVNIPPAEQNQIADTPAPGSRFSTNGTKRGFFSRINPFSGKSKTDSSQPLAAAPAPASAFPTAPRPVARYAFLSPAAPTSGDRAESEKAFKRGLKAQKGGSRSLAVTEYQAAVKSDPANYDAYYNLGLAALEGGDVRLSLWAYEIALALKPAAEDARYNFALALKAGGYWLDAVEQLQLLLSENSSDARAHLSLANLYSQQLLQPAQAREHYQRVLELNPRHPEASKIRYWLAANP